jgi:hypothetical protein
MKETRGSVLASVAGSLMYLGLAVWGRGGFAAFVSVPALYSGRRLEPSYLSWWAFLAR